MTDVARTCDDCRHAVTTTLPGGTVQHRLCTNPSVLKANDGHTWSVSIAWDRCRGASWQARAA